MGQAETKGDLWRWAGGFTKKVEEGVIRRRIGSNGFIAQGLHELEKIAHELVVVSHCYAPRSGHANLGVREIS